MQIQLKNNVLQKQTNKPKINMPIGIRSMSFENIFANIRCG